MARRFQQETTADRVSAAMTRAGYSAVSVSEATGIPVDGLTDRLTGRVMFTVGDLGKVGGFLRLRPSLLIGADA